MKTEINTKSRTVRNEETQVDGILYFYQLIEHACINPSHNPSYSIKVEMLMTDGVRSEASSDKIFTTLKGAEEFFEKLYKSLATPIDLAYVIEDEL